ncbi:ABC transporter ATP-binding protein [Paenibacillus senegalimassiliensis]|uniref:ABC transporter ATP-binding protein n=1 Tax=Paenibacillus senegalimassiliensis TaxID=1737426 RepID=UPI000AB230A5|nr:ABC transporter ATP-binding protein [Paenibacillus senegalimassiliensis]
MEAIRVEALSKKFVLNNRPKMLKDWILMNDRQKKKEFWALKNININIHKGESVGIIGRNGSGKSTLLKIISKILYPTLGSIETFGNVSSLLELGAGFKQDFTGRENVYLNASILGMNKQEVDKKFQSILEFSEIEEFIDQPVRTYSSGMYMRLAYSVAVSSNPDILLIDEILSVGDSKFKKKCIDKIMELKSIGTTILLVSHSDSMVQRVCDRLIWLDKGEMVMDGISEDVMAKYSEKMI